MLLLMVDCKLLHFTKSSVYDNPSPTLPHPRIKRNALQPISGLPNLRLYFLGLTFGRGECHHVTTPWF